MGNVIKRVDGSNVETISNDVVEYLEKEETRVDKLVDSSAFSLVVMAKKYDDWLLDPLVGFIIPAFGDIISSLAAIPAIYIAMFKLRSIKLTIAILYITMLDVLCGLIPGIGDIVDAFYMTNRKAHRWIVGYVEEDPDTISEINKSAAWGTVMLVVVGFLIYLLYSIAMSIVHWIGSLF